jgi:hypothetical protein
LTEQPASPCQQMMGRREPANDDEEDLMMLEDLSLDGACIGPNPKLEVATCLGWGELIIRAKKKKKKLKKVEEASL